MKQSPLSTLFLVLVLLTTIVSAAAAVPSAPALLAPSDKATTLAPLTLSWSAVSDPAGIVAYNWQISSSATFSPVLFQNSTSGQTVDTVSGLANGVYFWRVQAVNGSLVQGTWSATQSFTVNGVASGATGSPTLGPTKGYATFHPREVISFNWSAVPGAHHYVLQFSADPAFPVLTTGQFDNIPNTTFSFAPADEGFYSARVYAVDANGGAGVPSNVINYTVFYNNPLPPAPSNVAPANGAVVTLPLKLNWSDVLNPQPSGYELQIAKDSGFNTIEDSIPQITDAFRTELSLTSGTKFWRVRSHQGDASATTAAVTKWSATGTFTVSAAAPGPVSLTPVNGHLFSGDSTPVMLQLSGAAPSGGATISLSSSDPAAAVVPATVSMPGNTAWMQFPMQTGQVTAPVTVTLTATLNAHSASVQFVVAPPSLQSISIHPGTISGGAQPQAIIMLNGVAPAGGAVVNLSSSSQAANPPVQVTIPAGSPSVSFPLATSAVAAPVTASITATWNGTSAASSLTVTPLPSPSALTLSSAALIGGTAGTGRVTLSSPAASDTIFQITSSNPAVAVASPSVFIAAGASAGGFSLTTSAVTAPTAVVISVSGGGTTRSATLTVNPPAAGPQMMNLTVTATGRAGERITSTPAGISALTGGSMSASLAAGTTITLGVSSGRSAIWSGACSSGGQKTTTCRFTLNANAAVTANVQ